MLPFVSLNAATAAGVGTDKDLEEVLTNHMMLVATTGAPGFHAQLEISHDGVNWLARGDANSAADYFVKLVDEPARYVRANLSSFSGASATLTATIASA